MNNSCIYAFFDNGDKPYYIGKTSDFIVRKKRHERRIKNGVFLPKYNKARKLIRNGFPFRMEIIHENLTDDEAINLETCYIKEYQRMKYKLFNLTEGGEGSCGLRHKQSSIEKNRLKHLGKIPWNKGLTKKDPRVKANCDGRDKTMRLRGGQSGKNNPMYGRKGKSNPLYGVPKSKEHCAKISAAKMGLKNPQSKKCLIITPRGKRFTTCVNEFFKKNCKKYKISKSLLRGIANGIVKNNQKWVCRYIT